MSGSIIVTDFPVCALIRGESHRRGTSVECAVEDLNGSGRFDRVAGRDLADVVFRTSRGIVRKLAA